MPDWQALVRQHSPMVWQTAYRLLGNHADAADCVQDAFVSALALSERQAVRNWSGLLQRLATTRALDRLRQRLRQAGRQDDPPDWATVTCSDPDPMQRAEAAELASRLRHALAKLPPRQADVFCLRYLEDLSYRQIAQQLGIRTGTVGVVLQRARARLRELLASVAARQED